MNSTNGLLAAIRRASSEIDFKTAAPLLVLLSGVSAVVQIAPAQAQSITERQILDVLRRNPALIDQAATSLQQRQVAAAQIQLVLATKPVADKIIAGDPMVPVIGPAKGRPVVEFFDYNCGFCKQFSKNVVPQLLAGPRPARIHLVLAAILSPGSERMAEFAAAAKLQGRFEPAHHFLFDQSARSISDADALKPRLIAAAGLDKVKFDRALADGSAKAIVHHNIQLTQKAQITGTPLIYTNGHAHAGAMTYDELQAIMTR